MSNPVYEKLEKCLCCVREKTDFVPEVALVLGSGLGGYAKNVDTKAVAGYSEIEGFPISTAPGHKGRFVFGYVSGVPVVVMEGRVHYYEGYPITDVVLPVRLMAMIGAKKLILTNAAGGINSDFEPGTLMSITDHILYSVPNPLVGENIDELGVRFPDMSYTYSERMRQIVKEEALKIGVKYEEGVYIQFSGPSYETPAEIRMAKLLGADAVGMSTACEAIAARHMGMEICAISCITNPAAGISLHELTHAEVTETANRVSKQFEELITAVIGRI